MIAPNPVSTSATQDQPKSSVKRESGVSTAIRKTMVSLEKEETLIETSKPAEFTVKIANTLEEREAAFRLGYEVYLNKELIKENLNQWLINEYDANPDTTILIIKNKGGKVVGSVTLVFKNESPLPAEKVYKEEISSLAAEGKRLIELSRLVIAPEYRNSKDLIVLLFNYLSIYSFHVMEYYHLIIQVNPRHKSYYKKLLNFTEIGSEKMCPSVQNAPAVLLFLNICDFYANPNRESPAQETSKRDRTLYTYFLKPEPEKLVANYLATQKSIMSDEEKQYFGLCKQSIENLATV